MASMQRPGTPDGWEPGEVRNTRPMDPRPMGPGPIDNRPTDPRPMDPRSIELRPVEPRYIDLRPSDLRPMDRRPLDNRPMDPQPTNNRPLDPRQNRPLDPHQNRPVDPRQIDKRPIDPRPGVRGPIDPRATDRGPWVEFQAARDERSGIMTRLDETNARLDAFCEATTARLEKQSADIGELKNMLAELLKGGGGTRHEVREREVAGGPMADEKRTQKLAERRRAKMWDNEATRAWWLLSGDKPKHSLHRAELRGLLHKKALVTAAVATQLETLSGLDVGAFLPPGVDLDVATSLLVDRQMRVLGNSIMLVVGEEASNAGRTRVSQLGDALNEGVTLLEDYCMEKLAALQQPENRRRVVKLVNDDLQAWTTALHGTSAAAGQKWASPPGILELPPAVVPAWTKLRAYIDTGVILNDPIPRMNPAPSPSSRTSPADPSPSISHAAPSSRISPAAPNARINPAAPNTRISPAAPNTRISPAAPNTRISPAAPNTRISPAAPNTRISPAAPTSRINPAAPTTRISPAAPTSRISPASPNTRVSPGPPTSRINHAEGGGRPPAKRSRKEVGVCFQWVKKKTCRWGETCVYSHGADTKLYPAGNVKSEPVPGTYPG